MSNENMQAVLSCLSKNKALHIIIENEIKATPYGTLSVNVMVKNGVADLSTMNIVHNRRKRYQLDKTGK